MDQPPSQTAIPPETKRVHLFSGGIGIFCLLALLFVISQFIRVSNAVVAHELVRDLDLSVTELGLLGSAFFYAFAAVQIPLGWALDRFRPGLMVALIPLLCALGIFLFSAADGFGMAFAGRLLMGVGMSAALMGSFKVFSIRYAPYHFATLCGVIVSIGTLGNMAASTPLVLLVEAVGWRMAFAMVGVGIVLISLANIRLLRSTNEDPGERAEASPAKTISLKEGLKFLARSLIFYQTAFITFFRYGTFVALQGLWGGPYLRDALGFSAVQTGNILFFFAIGAVFGSTLSGRLSDRVFRTRKWVTVPAITVYTLMFLCLSGLVTVKSFWANAVLFFLTAFFGSAAVIVYTHIKESCPKEMTGLALTSVNLFNMGGAAIVMHLLGYVVGYFHETGGGYPPEAFHTAFFLCFLGNTAALIFYAFSKDTKPA